MAKSSFAEICKTVLAVNAQLSTGAKLTVACKTAGVSPATYKRWLEKYPTLDLPLFVLPAPTAGSIALSGDGKTLFIVGVVGRHYELTRHDASIPR
jgi:hypothetical protein